MHSNSIISKYNSITIRPKLFYSRGTDNNTTMHRKNYDAITILMNIGDAPNINLKINKYFPCKIFPDNSQLVVNSLTLPGPVV